MNIAIEGTLVTSGFVGISKSGLSLFVNTLHKRVDLHWSSSNPDNVRFGFEEEESGITATITFTPESVVERELLTDACRFVQVDKDQWHFLFVKWGDLEELK